MGKISEYIVYQRSYTEEDKNFYNIGSTLVEETNDGYYDLINNKEIDFFNPTILEDGYQGIVYEKDIKYYKDVLIKTHNTYQKELNVHIIDLVNSLKALNLTNYDMCMYVDSLRNYKLKAKNHRFINLLNKIKDYLSKSHKLTFDIESIFKKIEDNINNYQKKYIQITLNINLLKDLNGIISLSRLNPKKSIMLYAQNNGMIIPTEESWQLLNTYTQK